VGCDGRDGCADDELGHAELPGVDAARYARAPHRHVAELHGVALPVHDEREAQGLVREGGRLRASCSKVGIRKARDVLVAPERLRRGEAQGDWRGV